MLLSQAEVQQKLSNIFRNVLEVFGRTGNLVCVLSSRQSPSHGFFFFFSDISGW